MSRKTSRTIACLGTAALLALGGVVTAAPASAVDTQPTPIRAIGGDATGLVFPIDIAVAADGTTWVGNDNADFSAGSLLGFAAGASGNVPPVYDIAGAATGLLSPYGVAVDSSGNVWVADSAANTVSEFAAGSTGNVAPLVTISGASTGLKHPTAIAIVPDGTIYVENEGASILVFSGGSSGDVAPTRTIKGSATTLDDAWGIALTSDYSIVVADQDANAVTTFSPTASGNAAPLRRISGSKTLLNVPSNVAIDPFGNLYVADGFDVAKYSPSATGNVAPEFLIVPGATWLARPWSVATDSTGNLFVLNVSDGPPDASITVYAPVTSVEGLSVFSVSPSIGGPGGGETITISGHGFISGATVTIGGRAATDVNVLSSSTITAVVPAGRAGAADVTVTQNPGVCSCTQVTDTITDGFTYDPPHPRLATTGVDPEIGFIAALGLLVLGALLLAVCRRFVRA